MFCTESFFWVNSALTGVLKCVDIKLAHGVLMQSKDTISKSEVTFYFSEQHKSLLFRPFFYPAFLIHLKDCKKVALYYHVLYNHVFLYNVSTKVFFEIS